MSLSILGVAFVVLKLCHVINWSWWWVTAPFYAGAVIWAFLVALVAFGEVRKERAERARYLKRRHDRIGRSS